MLLHRKRAGEKANRSRAGSAARMRPKRKGTSRESFFLREVGVG